MPGANSIDGISSGLNTTEIIDSIIAFERRNAVLLEQQKVEKTNVITTYKALQAKVLALNAEVSKLTKATAFNAATIAVSDESVLTASRSGTVAVGSYNLQVLSMARNHQMASQGLADQSLSILGTGTISIQIGDGSAETITIDSTKNSLVGISRAINDAKLGVSATIVNDGSSSNPFRLMLTSEKTGRSNAIKITSDLTGGVNLNYDTATFDSPEVLSFDSSSNSQVSLGATASFTGTTNKVYTFTVQGTGSQTIGTDNITIDWTDGTTSGSIIVTQADTEVELVGATADGLKLSLSAGQLTAGDTFQVTTFAPLIQEASDAQVSFGAGGGAGSPILVTSDTNSFTNVIGGVNFTVARETETGESVTISTDVDVSGIKEKIDGLIKRYNEIVDYIDEQNTYNKDTNESGVLFGDSSLWLIRYGLSNITSDKIENIDSAYNQLYSIGIRSRSDGHLAIVDYSRFEDALRNNLEDVSNLFTSAGSSSHAGIQFISSNASTVIGENYDVDITVAASRGKLEGSELTDLGSTPITLTNSNNRLKFKINGRESNELILTEKTYTSSDELVAEIQAKIDADDNIGDRGLTVEWVDNGGNGYLKFTSASYGASSCVELLNPASSPARTILGLSDAVQTDGVDVEGTINGEEAEGIGQLLRGKSDNETTDGLVLKVTMDGTLLVDGAEGTITLTKGIAARMSDVIGSFTMEKDGLIDRRIISYQNQVSNLDERIIEIDKRLAIRRNDLYKQFYAMEEALGQFDTTNKFLTEQLSNINNNWGFRRQQ